MNERAKIEEITIAKIINKKEYKKNKVCESLIRLFLFSFDLYDWNNKIKKI